MTTNKVYGPVWAKLVQFGPRGSRKKYDLEIFNFDPTIMKLCEHNQPMSG